MAEAPYGAYDGIWVYMGSSTPITLVPGDVVCICGEYKEYFDLSEIDIVSAGLYGSVLKTGSMAVPAPSYVTAAELEADPEPWESCVITITDGMTVADTSLGYGEWMALAWTAPPCISMISSTMTPPSTRVICYNNATGVYTYSYSQFKLEPFADGIELTDCAVDTEDATLSALKALYR